MYLDQKRINTSYLVIFYGYVEFHLFGCLCVCRGACRKIELGISRNFQLL